MIRCRVVSNERLESNLFSEDPEEIEESKKPVDGDSTDTDVTMKDQSSAYSPSHLSEELRNEASTKQPELKKETKSSEDGKTKVEESSPNSVVSSENTLPSYSIHLSIEKRIHRYWKSPELHGKAS